MQQNGIGYVLNASNTCPKPDFIPESHFLRVPVNDSFCEKILPWLDKSVDFIGEQLKYHYKPFGIQSYVKCTPSPFPPSLPLFFLKGAYFRDFKSLKSTYDATYLIQWSR